MTSNNLASESIAQIAFFVMGTNKLKLDFKELLNKEHPTENAYTKYAALVDEKVSRITPLPHTHVVVWTNKHGLSGKLDQITRFLTGVIPRGSAYKAKPFSFKTSHALDESRLEDIEASIHRGSALETLSSFTAGIFAWLFFLSIPLLPVLGLTFLSLTTVSFLGFWGSIYSLSTARYRFLPNELKDISADYWAIHSLTRAQSKENLSH